MKNLRYVAAECYPGCEDQSCPYIHRDGWTCDELKGELFATPNDVVRAVGPLLHPDDVSTAQVTERNDG